MSVFFFFFVFPPGPWQAPGLARMCLYNQPVAPGNSEEVDRCIDRRFSKYTNRWINRSIYRYIYIYEYILAFVEDRLIDA